GHCEQDHYHLHIAVILLRVVDGERHRQAADDQHERIDKAHHHVEVIAARGKRHRKSRTENEIDRKQPAEEHDLLNEEHPHPDGDALFLLLHVLELVLESRLVVDKFIGCCVCRHYDICDLRSSICNLRFALEAICSLSH